MCLVKCVSRKHQKLEVFVSTKDFMGARTAMFSKTRLGKGNIVKLIAQSLIETDGELGNVGQIVFDINGKHALHCLPGICFDYILS